MRHEVISMNNIDQIARSLRAPSPYFRLWERS